MLQIGMTYSCFSSTYRYDVFPSSTQAIIKVLRSRGFPGQQVDYLYVLSPTSVFYLLTICTRYVDEAQDNLLIDALRK